MPPLHYVVFHPERCGYKAIGEAVVAGKHEKNWQGTVWTDPYRRKAGSNEDPFVWHSEWLYSFCHASQLRRKQSMSRSYVRAGSHIFFCETRAAKQGSLKVDTVFVVSSIEPWMQRAKTVPARFTAHQESGQTAVWRRHLQHGIDAPDRKGTHMGEYTYVAQLNGDSYLPLTMDGMPVSLPVQSILGRRQNDLSKALPDGQTTRPFILEDAERLVLLDAVVKAAHTRVLRLCCSAPEGPQVQRQH